MRSAESARREGGGPGQGIQHLLVVGEELDHRFVVVELGQQTRVLGILVTAHHAQTLAPRQSRDPGIVVEEPAKALVVDHYVPDQQVPFSTYTRGYSRPRQ